MRVRFGAVVGFALVVLSAFFFAVSGPIAKALYTIGWTPGAVVLIRLTGASLILLIPSLLALRGRWGEVRRGWKTVVAYGVVSMAGVQAFFFLAVEHLSVAVAILLEMMGAPVIIVLWLWWRTRIRPATLTFVGILVSVAGVVLVLGVRGASLSWWGIAMALAAAACLAGYFLVSANQRIALPPIGLTGLGMGVGALAIAAVNLVQVMPTRVVLEDLDFAGVRVSWLVPTVLLIVFTVGAYVCGIMGLRLIGATVGSFVNLFEVPFSVIAAWIILSEEMGLRQLIGGAVIIAGIVFIKWGDVRLEQRLARLQGEGLPPASLEPEPPPRAPVKESSA